MRRIDREETTRAERMEGQPACPDPSRRAWLGRAGLLLSAAALPRWSLASQESADRSAPSGLPSPIEAWARHGDGYETQRRSMVWQAFKPQREPDLIVRAESEADVVETLRYAADRDMPVAVRCGGHSYVAAFLRDGGILLDVSRLRSLEIDRDRRTFTAQPGVGAAELSALLAAEDLAFPVAHAPTVTLGGYLLGGGMGWNGESWGRIACANVRGLTVVSAAAETLSVDGNSHPDLFRAARGSGPAFCGAVTAFRLRAFPRPPAILHSVYVFPAELAGEVGRWLQQAASGGTQDLELTLVLGTEHDGAARSAFCVASVTSFADSAKDGEAALRALAGTAPRGDALSVEEFRAVTMGELFAASETAVPRRIAADNIWTDRPLEALERIVPHAATAASPDSVVIVNFRGATGVPDGMAFSVTGSAYALWMASWPDPLGDADNLRWVDRAAELLEPLSRGVYVNETDFFRRPEWARRCFSGTAWEHLRAVRARYDPRGRFPAPFGI